MSLCISYINQYKFAELEIILKKMAVSRPKVDLGDLELVLIDSARKITLGCSTHLNIPLGGPKYAFLSRQFMQYQSLLR